MNRYWPKLTVAGWGIPVGFSGLSGMQMITVVPILVTLQGFPFMSTMTSFSVAAKSMFSPYDTNETDKSLVTQWYSVDFMVHYYLFMDGWW